MRETNLITTKSQQSTFKSFKLNTKQIEPEPLIKIPGWFFFLHSLIQCFPVYIEINQYSSNHLPIFNSKFLYQYQTEESRTE